LRTYPFATAPTADLAANNPFVNATILCPTNAAVAEVNAYVTSLMQGESRVYTAFDAVQEPGLNKEFWPTEQYKSMCFTNFPPFDLELKRGMVVLMCRTLDRQLGRVNSSRHIVLDMLPRYVTLLSIEPGPTFGDVFRQIPIKLYLEDDDLPFVLRRSQLPLCPALSMTGHKSQGATFVRVGMYLTTPIFAHGWLYVCLSRVGSPNGICILVKERSLPQDLHDLYVRHPGLVLNVVYRDIITRAVGDVMPHDLPTPRLPSPYEQDNVLDHAPCPETMFMTNVDDVIASLFH
jgi:hypothetical protein